MTRVLFVSPHADDAVLSSGGTIARLIRARHTVTVATVFSATGDESVRAAEDARALGRLGAERVALGLRDFGARAPLRRMRPGLPRDGAAARVAVREAIAELARAADVVVAPLAVGPHPDHHVTFAACAEVERPLIFFEDMPYALCPGATAARLAQLAAEPPRGLRLRVVAGRLAMMRWWMARPALQAVAPAPFRPLAAWLLTSPGAPDLAPLRLPLRLVEERVETHGAAALKMAAVADYATQWPALVRTLAELRAAFAGHARALGSPVLVERFFRPIGSARAGDLIAALAR